MTPTLQSLDQPKAAATLKFLKCCYRFVSEEWPHAQQEELPDQGFERQFRETCVRHLPDWQVSDERELHLGAGYTPASGVMHEVDIVARHSETRAVAEMKNRADAVGKNDIIVFFAKVLDYILANPALALEGLCLAFVCRASFEPRGLATCLGLGIHPVCSKIRPLPVLKNTVDILTREVRLGLRLPDDLEIRLADLRAEVANISVGLNDIWLDNRLGYQSETTLSIRAIPPIHADAFTQRFTRANSTCSDILKVARTFKSSEGQTS